MLKFQDVVKAAGPAIEGLECASFDAKHSHAYSEACEPHRFGETCSACESKFQSNWFLPAEEIELLPFSMLCDENCDVVNEFEGTLVPLYRNYISRENLDDFSWRFQKKGFDRPHFWLSIQALRMLGVPSQRCIRVLQLVRYGVDLERAVDCALTGDGFNMKTHLKALMEVPESDVYVLGRFRYGKKCYPRRYPKKQTIVCKVLHSAIIIGASEFHENRGEHFGEYRALRKSWSNYRIQIVHESERVHHVSLVEAQ